MSKDRLRAGADEALQNIAHDGNVLQRYAQGHPTGALIRLSLLYRKLGGLYISFAQDAPSSAAVFNRRLGVVSRTAADVKKVARSAGLPSCGPR